MDFTGQSGVLRRIQRCRGPPLPRGICDATFQVIEPGLLFLAISG